MTLESKKRILGGVFFVSLAIFMYVLLHKSSEEVFVVSAIDVGQGSAMYVRTETGVEMLVDTGPSSKLFRSLGRLRPVFDRDIDYVVISHVDNDHMAMTPRLLSEYNVGSFVSNRAYVDNGLYKETHYLLERLQTKILLPVSGDRLILDHETYLDFLWPEVEEKYMGNRNDSSIVLRLVHGSNSVLFTGDISQSVEKELVKKYGTSLKSDILFVSHHGSKSSTASEFVQIVDPDYAVIQSGAENRYGHPHADVIETLSELQVPILRNDISGTITFIFDQGQILIQ